MSKLAIHTDFLSTEFNELFLDFFNRLPRTFELHLFLESKLLLHNAKFLIKREFALKVYPVLRQQDYKENFEIAELLELLDSVPTCEMLPYPNYFVDVNKNTPEKRARDVLMLTNTDTLVLGETLLCGKGLQLAEIAISKNKKVFCFPMPYFSYGYDGFDFLVKSGSVQILCPAYINEL